MTVTENDLLQRAMGEFDTLLSLRRRSFCSQPLNREVSIVQIHILGILQEGGPITVSDLARLLAVSTPSASTIVDRMEEHGLVVRERDAIDRRVVHVRIAERGCRVFEEMIGPRREALQRLLGTMADEELLDVIHGVEAVRRAIDRMTWAMPDHEDENRTQ